LHRSCGTARHREKIEHAQHQNRHDELHSHGIDTNEHFLHDDWQRVDGRMQRQDQRRGSKRHCEARSHLAPSAYAPCEAPGEPRAQNEAGDDRYEEPRELGFRQMPQPEHDRRRRSEVGHHRANRETCRERKQAEFVMRCDPPGSARKIPRVQGRAPLLRVSLRKMQEAYDHESHADEHHEAEHAAPAERDVDPTADHRRDRRRNAKYHRNGAHQALRLRSFMQVAHDGTADGHADARAHSLHRAERQEPRKARRYRAANRRCGVDRKPGKHDGPAAERVGQRSEYQRHDREWHKVRRERLLHLPGAERELRLDRGK